MKSHFLESLEILEKRVEAGPVSLNEIVDLLGARGHLILILFVGLPFMQPIPLPGLSTPLGLLVLILSVLNYLGRPPWIPQKFKAKTFRKDQLLGSLRVAERIWGLLEKILEPRWKILFNHPFFRFFNTLVLCSQALLLMLPLPVPFSNNIPAIVIVINALGELEEDGFVVLLSYVFLAGSLAFFSGLAVGLESGFQYFSR